MQFQSGTGTRCTLAAIVLVGQRLQWLEQHGWSAPLYGAAGIANRPKLTKLLLDAGADFIAVCQAVWSKDDPGAAVARFNEVFAA